MQRLAIFFFFDKDGQVRDFVPYFINALHSVCDTVCTVVNGNLTDEGRERLSAVSDDLFVRGNTGFDVWAYKEAMEHIGWENVTDFDELVLCNFTCYGPVYPFAEMFEKMSHSDCDFWGAVKHPEQPDYLLPPSKGYIYEHIMSYFTVIRSRMLRSKDFKDYWCNVPEIKTKRESTAYHETVFTKYFEDLGYSSDAFVDLDNYRGRCNNSSIFLADELLIKDRCPLVKRRAFAFPLYGNLLAESAGKNATDLLKYISENTDFDCDMIWQDLIETQKMSVLCNNMHLNSIISGQNAESVDMSSIAFLIYVKSVDYFDLLSPHLEKLPSGSRVILLCSDNDTFEKCSQVKSAEVRDVNTSNFSSPVASLLACQDVISQCSYCCCILSDHYVNARLSQSWEDHCNIVLDNLIESEQYISNIIGKFSSDKHMGALRPLKSSFSTYYAQTYNYVCSKMSYYSSVHNMLQLTVPLDDGTLMSDMDAGFWIRADILNHICSMLDNHSTAYMLSKDMSFEYMLPMIVQEKGYYTSSICTEKNAVLELDNQIFMQHHMLGKLKASGCGSHRFYDVEHFAAKARGNSRKSPNVPIDMQVLLNQKIGLRYLLLLLLRYPGNKLDNIKQWIKKRFKPTISYQASIINIVPEGERAVFYYVAGSRRNHSKYFNQNMYLLIDGKKYFTNKHPQTGQSMVSEFNRDFNYGEPLFFEVPISKLADKTIALYDSNNRHINVRWNANFSFNALELREYGLYVRVCDGDVFIQTKENFCNSVLKSSKYSGQDKRYFRKAMSITEHPYTLIAENGGAADNSYQLFKYAVAQGENVLYIASQKIVASEKNPELKKRMVVYNSKKHAEVTLRSKRWIGSFSLRLEIVPTKYLHDIHYAMLPAEWDFIPHGMAIGDKIVKMLHMYSWHNPSRTFASVPLEAEAYSNMYDFKNVCSLGAPRMDKWADAYSDENEVMIFFTWRIALSQRAGFSNLRNFVETDYFKIAESVVKCITESFPDRKVYYVFHHEIEKNGMDKVMREALGAYGVNFISFGSADGAETFNSVFYRAKYLVTDFSSVAFDFAYKTGSIPIYYLPHKFVEGHYPLTEKFYETQLGVVAKTEDELVTALQMDKPTAEMKRRKDEFFVYQDGKNCERVFNAIFRTPAPESFLPERKKLFIPDDAKRLGIYYISDEENIIDNYVLHYLRKLREVCAEICVVINGEIEADDEQKLADVSDRIIKLDKEGADEWAYKRAIEQYGFDEIANSFDELILNNSTNFGPVFPFKEMFSEMSRHDCDLWGCIRERGFIDTDFIVFRRSILKSDDFISYWTNSQNALVFIRAEKSQRTNCSRFFERCGYISDEYVSYEKYKQFSSPSVRFAYKLISEDRNPLISRSVFINDNDRFVFPQSDIYSAYDVMQYIVDNTDYPAELIAENMERTMVFPQEILCPENDDARAAGNECTDINKKCKYYMRANLRFDPQKLYHRHE